ANSLFFFVFRISAKVNKYQSLQPHEYESRCALKTISSPNCRKSMRPGIPGDVEVENVEKKSLP
ncbi:unnamed protein product, partial [Amoebophrya sp. A120]